MGGNPSRFDGLRPLIVGLITNPAKLNLFLTYAYKAEFNKNKLYLKGAKRKSWICFYWSIEGVDNVARYGKTLSKDPKSIGSRKQDNGTWINSGTETLDLLSGTHFPGCKDSMDNYQYPPNIVQQKMRDL